MRLLLLFSALAVAAATVPTAYNDVTNVKYIGTERNGIEVFLGIPYGQDTGGANRFKPPQPFIPAPGSTIDATKPGPPCPQQLGQWNAPLTLLNVTSISEDCLNLNVARPKVNKTGLDTGRGLPVMVWIHGGSFWVGSNMEPTTQPDGLLLESLEAGYPVIHVAMNYRLGLFGFAQSESLKKEKSENAGLRDQRLAIEWVRDYIQYFGGDPDRITIFGQSSGGLAVGMQLLAYGGTKELPYQRGICESQALEPGITGNFTIDAMTAVAQYVDCAAQNSSVHTPEVITCLRTKDTQTLFDASFATYKSDIAHNIGDIWLPSVDGDFLPDAPSKLIDEGRFGNASYMFGWAQDDVNFFTDTSIVNSTGSLSFLTGYLPKMPPDVWHEDDGLLALYPISDFAPPPDTSLMAEFYRTAAIFRDILMVCEPIYFAEALHKRGNPVYLYNWNQTLLDPIIESEYNVSGMGVIHTSEFAYIFGNLSTYNVSGYPFNPTQSDYDLLRRATRSWSLFAWTANPSDEHVDSLQGWTRALYTPRGPANPPRPGYTYVYTIGGPREGLSALSGPDSFDEVARQRLAEKCAYLNHPSLIPFIQF